MKRFLGENGWTGGQYSLFRFIFGSYLLVHFANLIPWGAEMYSNRGVLPDASASPLTRLFPNVLAMYDAPWFVTALLIAAVPLAAMIAIGWRDRIAAVALWYLWACFFGRNPLTSNPGLPYVGLMLLAHALLPPAPYGSLQARGRVNPDGGWRMPQSVWAVVWILMAVGYTYSGLMKLTSPSWLDGSAVRHILENPLARPTPIREALLATPAWLLRSITWVGLALEIGFAPLALFRRLRPWVWLAGLAMHLSLMALIDFADLSLGMVMLHLFTFNPSWVAPARDAAGATVFYDGHCGLCHRTVRFILAEDRHAAFRLAPLQGETFEKAVDASRRAKLPDSVIALTRDGRLFTRSCAILFILRGLGGAWRAVAVIGGLIPRFIRDAVYDGIARIRRRLFAMPTDVCPMMPPEMRSRFAV
jgi:predicted DCC family thiol-disulfide oxidoreductase YuxK